MKNIALTWWWTWGHIFPLLSIYNYFKNTPDTNFIWFWDENGLEAEIAWNNNIPFVYIPSGKLRRYFDIRNFFEPLKNISWFFFALYYLFSNKIDIIFSKWWYVSVPVCLAGYILRKKIYIHESDSVWGLANNIIWKLASKIFYTFPNEKIDWVKHILTGQILNPELFQGVVDDFVEYDENWEEVYKENEKLEVLVIAGSQGSTIIFENLISVINNLIDVDFTVILWEKNLWYKEKFSKFNNVKTYDFVTQNELKNIYKNTDIAITRAWATSLWELYYFGVHSIIIPLSTSAQNHQFHNAQYFKENFQSEVLDENNQLNLSIFRTISKYITLRKSWLNIKWNDYALRKIKQEII